MRHTPKHLLVICIAGILTGVVLPATSVLAKGNKTAKSVTDKPKSGWQVQCNDAGSGLLCKASQSMILRKTGQRLLAVTVQHGTDNKTASVIYQIPLGLFLPTGVQVGFDDSAPKTLPIQTCDAQGCYAAAVLADGELNRMRKGKLLKVVYTSLKKKPIALHMHLEGFNAAYGKLK